MKTVVLAFLALLLLASMVFAQPYGSAASLISGGFYWPTSSETGSLFDSIWLNLGLEFKVAQGDKIDHYAGIGWLHAPGETFNFLTDAGIATADSDLDVIPISYTQRWRPHPRSKFYAGGGVDLFITMASFDIDNNGERIDDETEDVIPGLHILGGYAFTENLRLEARYTYLDEAEVFDSMGQSLNEDFSGIGVTLVGAF